MIKEDIIRIFKLIKEKKCNFVINTKIAEGHGINGVDFKTYCGLFVSDEYGSREISEIEVCDNFLMVYYFSSHKRDYLNRGKHLIILPYDSIASIDLILDNKYYKDCYPNEIDFALTLPVD